MNSGTFWLSKKPDSVSFGWDAALPMICSYAKISNSLLGDTFWVFNTHFDHIGIIARNESVKLISKLISRFNNNNSPVILMGDFNMTPDAEPIKRLSENFSDNWLEMNKNKNSGMATFNGFDPLGKDGKRIDYIFTKGFEVIECNILNDKRKNGNVLSDHFAVLSVLRNH